MSRATIVSKSQSSANLSSKQANGKSQSANVPPPIAEEGPPVAADRRHALTLAQKRGTTGESKKDVAEEKKKDYRKELSEKLEPLNFPRGLQQKALIENPDKPMDSVQERLVGLPGKLELDMRTTQKYFGDTARDKFFNRYQWLSEQRLKTSKSSSEELDKLYFEQDNDDENGANDDSIPFAPKRILANKNTKGVLITQSEHLNEDDDDDNIGINEEQEAAMLEELRIKEERDAVSSQATVREWGKDSRRPTLNITAKATVKKPVRILMQSKSKSKSQLGARPSTEQSSRLEGQGLRNKGIAGGDVEIGNKRRNRVDKDAELRKIKDSVRNNSGQYSDTYSDLILDSLMRPKTAGGALGGDGNGDGSSKGKKRTNRQDDDMSIMSESTVSTFGLFYNDEKLQSSMHHEIDFSRCTITSPRSKYIVGCIQAQLQPRAALLLRKNISKQLNLQHLGIGNQRARLLADAINALPFVQSINIADNMLSDEGMGPIILAAVNIPGLLELNLSQNIIGPVSSNALFEYLVSSKCPLERLILNGADVDDYECQRFVEAIQQNKSLKELDMSSNKVGMAENLNTVMPDLVTGGEALADLLRSPQCNLTKLKLDWNMIRLGGANDLAQSLSVNKTLTYLDLSYNSLSTEGGVILGMSLLKNNTLETLAVANNSLDATACFCICAGVVENRKLKKVVLDGNPIGIQGVRVLMMVPLIAGNRVTVSASNCNTSIKDSKCWFDFDKLIRDYTLRMDNGFERAVAIILVHLIAGHPSYVFSKFDYEIVGKVNKVRSIELEPEVSTENVKYFTAKQNNLIASLKRVQDAASDIQTAIRLFQEVDEDCSGELDKEELRNLMTKMGLHISHKRLNDLMNKYDVDQGGKLELHEFLMLLKSQYKEASSRMKELTECPVMVYKHDTKTRYVPPETGILHITVMDGFARKKIYRIMNACDREAINAVTREVGGISGMNMLSSSLQGTKLRLDEALSVAETMLQDSQDRVGVLKKLLLQVNDAEDTRNLIQSLLEDNRTDMMRLKRDMGAALRPILGQPNGYYVLDLSKEIDRICLGKLLEISSTTAVERSEASKIGYGRVGDLSQKGNWSSFRNELFNGKPVVLGPSFACPMPRSGKLEFDFSGGGRPNRDAIVLSDSRVIKLLLQHFLLDQKDYAVALQKLRDAKNASDKTLGCDGNTYYECPMERMRLIGEHVEIFYNSVHLRMKQYCDSLEKESSTQVDAQGVLVEPFERDSKYPIPLSIRDHYIRLEARRKEEEERIALEKALAAEKAAQKADRNSMFFGFRPTPPGSTPASATPSRPASAAGAGAGRQSVITTAKSPAPAPPIGRQQSMIRQTLVNPNNSAKSNVVTINLSANQVNGQKIDDDVLSVVSEGSDSTNSHVSDGDKVEEEEEDPDQLQHLQSLMSLKTALANDDDVEATDLHNDSVESLEWLREYELLKQATTKPKDPYELKKANVTLRRHNIGHQENYLRLAHPDEFLDKFRMQLLSPQLTLGAKAHRIIDTLEDLFARSWILCRHLALIVECFAHYGYLKQTKFFGTYRIDLIVALFARVVDVHNFEQVMEVLSPFEAACAYCRLGFLNLYNPCKPEGSWELDLGRREERVLAKTLCVLATHEPGDNWTFNTFRWMRTMESMPGWELTQPWLTEDGMPMRGLLNITYYSGEGKKKKGCRPYISFRKSLLNLVLINEDEIVAEDMYGKPPSLLTPGDKAFSKHINLWENYLAPEHVDPNRKR